MEIYKNVVQGMEDVTRCDKKIKTVLVQYSASTVHGMIRSEVSGIWKQYKYMTVERKNIWPCVNMYSVWGVEAKVIAQNKIQTQSPVPANKNY